MLVATGRPVHRERQRQAQDSIIQRVARNAEVHHHNNHNTTAQDTVNPSTTNHQHNDDNIHHYHNHHQTPGKMGSNPDPQPALPYWQVNVAPEDRQTECPEALRNLSAKDIGIISTVS